MNGLLALAAALVLGGATLLAGRRWQAELAAQAELARSAEELRAEIARREAAEAGLHAAQRLEAVGRLTGGVAHDFNNLLTAVLGSVQLLERHLQHLGRAGCPEGGPLDAKARRLLTTARDAVERGTRLTSSLLAFARRQALRAEPLDANALVAGMLPLLRRALGETAELRLALGRGVPPCLADAAQLESALLNLVINARDALPASGGSVAIRTFRADPAAQEGAGQVCIAVADNGTGMPRRSASGPSIPSSPPSRSAAAPGSASARSMASSASSAAR
jgi:signal transduction histidine kinase